MEKFKSKLVLIGALMTVFTGASNAQVAQAVIGSMITVDSGTSSGPLVVVSPDSQASPLKWLDIRCNFDYSVHPIIDGTPAAEWGSHVYYGFVRVKWIGPLPPNPITDYGAVFAVWSMRNGFSNVSTIRPQPGARTLGIDSDVGNFFLDVLNLAVSCSPSNPSDNDSGGTFPVVGIYNESLPSIGNDGIWTRKDDFVSAASFYQAPDTFWYADVEVSGATSFSAYTVGSASNGWNLMDTGYAKYDTRIVYQLVEVAGLPVL